jgi:hypothetical protein
VDSMERAVETEGSAVVVGTCAVGQDDMDAPGVARGGCWTSFWAIT